MVSREYPGLELTDLDEKRRRKEEKREMARHARRYLWLDILDLVLEIIFSVFH